MFPSLFKKEIEDTFIQENFRRIVDYFAGEPLNKCGFKFFKIEVPGAVTNFKWPHSLGYQPKDVIVMHNEQNATVTFNYLKFNSTSIDLTSSGATTLRILLGRFEN